MQFDKTTTQIYDSQQPRNELDRGHLSLPGST